MACVAFSFILASGLPVKGILIVELEYTFQASPVELNYYNTLPHMFMHKHVFIISRLSGVAAALEVHQSVQPCHNYILAYCKKEQIYFSYLTERKNQYSIENALRSSQGLMYETFFLDFSLYK